VCTFKPNPLIFFLAFTAGCVNTIGFLDIQQHLSHMTGTLSLMSYYVATGQSLYVILGMLVLGMFVMGSMCATVIIHCAKTHHIHSKYALPFLIEAILLFMFSLINIQSLNHILASPLVVSAYLSFTMGLHNAVVTKMTQFKTRATHVTGILTDIGIELGRWLYAALNNTSLIGNTASVSVFNKNRLTEILLVIICFFIGGLTGAVFFDWIGYVPVMLLSLILAWLTIPVVFKDIVLVWRRK
jgi:uncharacterized membrane protein YoaK (UPF0700 family)